MPIVPLPGSPPSPPGAEGWCGWDVDPTDMCSSWASLTTAQKEAAARIATLVMWAATGRRYGPCQLTLRPCQTKEWAETYRAYPAWWGLSNGGAGFFPVLNAGQWTNCGCGSGCCCQVRCAVVLPGPVAAIQEVLVHGEIVPSTDYRVDIAEGEYHLVRMTGGCWPTCQDFNELADGDHAFAVTYTRGAEVPGSVLDATSILACQFGKQLAEGDCGLPPRLQSLTRQGVSAEFIVDSIDVNSFFTGINMVDMVIRAENPSRRTRPPAILSPDAPTARDRITVIGGP